MTSARETSAGGAQQGDGRPAKGPVRLGVGGPVGSGRQWQSWISLADEVNAIEFLLTANVQGPVNLTAPNPVTGTEFARALGRALHRPALMPVPSFGPKLLLGSELADALLFTGQRKIRRHALAKQNGLTIRTTAPVEGSTALARLSCAPERSISVLAMNRPSPSPVPPSGPALSGPVLATLRVLTYGSPTRSSTSGAKPGPSSRISRETRSGLQRASIETQLSAKSTALSTMLPAIEPDAPPLPSCRVPPLIVVAPEYDWAPVSMILPVPVFCNVPAPEMIPS